MQAGGGGGGFGGGGARGPPEGNIELPDTIYVTGTSVAADETTLAQFFGEVGQLKVETSLVGA